MKSFAPGYYDTFMKANGDEPDPGIKCLLQHPVKIHRLNIPLKMDDGSISLVKFTRYVYTEYLGPALGPLYISEGIADEELLLHSFENTIANAMLGIPFSGAAGCLDINCRSLSPGETERLGRGLVFMNHLNMGSDIDIYYPSKNISPELMDFINNTHNIIKSRHGLPVALGGNYSKFNRREFEELSLNEILKKVISASECSRKIKNGKTLSFVLASTGEREFRIAKILEEKYNARLSAITAYDDFFLLNQHKTSEFYQELLKSGKKLLDLPDEKFMNTEETFKFNADILIIDNCDIFSAIDHNRALFTLIIETTKSNFNFKLDKLFHAKSVIYIPAIIFSLWESAYYALELLNCRNFCYISNNQVLVERYLMLLNKAFSRLSMSSEIPFRIELLKMALNNLQQAIFRKGILP